MFLTKLKLTYSNSLICPTNSPEPQKYLVCHDRGLRKYLQIFIFKELHPLVFWGCLLKKLLQ